MLYPCDHILKPQARVALAYSAETHHFLNMRMRLNKTEFCKSQGALDRHPSNLCVQQYSEGKSMVQPVYDKYC